MLIQEEIRQILDNEPVNSVRTVAREANISRYQTMRVVIRYKPYMMHNVQQLYDEDMDLCVEMSEHLIPIHEHQRNDGSLLFTFAGW